MDADKLKNFYIVEKDEDFNDESADLNAQNGLDLSHFFSPLRLVAEDAKDKVGDEPLQHEIRASNSKIRERLLPLKYPDEEGNSEEKTDDETKYLSKLGKMVLEQDKGLLKDYDVFGNSGRSAIHLAALLSDLNMCKWLLNKGIDVRFLTKNEHEESVLHCAAMNKSHGKELVRFFVSKLGFDVNAKDKLEFTPLHRALLKDNIQTAEELLKLGADLTVKITSDTNNMENLMHSCIRWNKMISAKYLHEKNRNLVNELRGDGRTSLHIAANCADLAMCKWLVDECGLDPLALAGNQKLSVLDDAACNKRHGKEIITFFVKMYALDVNRNAGHWRLTPLHHAFFNNNIVAAEELLRLGADIKAKKFRQNLLQFSVRHNKVESVKYLFEKHPVLVAGAGKSIVSLAKRHAGEEIKKFLVEKGFSLKASRWIPLKYVPVSKKSR